jgi:GxxExxY protein
VRGADGIGHEDHEDHKDHKERWIKESYMETRPFEAIPAEVERVGRRVIGCAIAAHRNLGPGYKESIDVEAMCMEMDSRGLTFEREKAIKVFYKGKPIPSQRLDLIVEQVLIAECTVTEAIIPIHTRQVRSYLKTTGLRLGLIFNFNVNVLMKEGFKRIVL